MKFKELAEVFSRVEKTSLRNEKTEILADLLRRVDETELEAVIYLSLGRLRPLYDSLELNLAEKMAVRVVGWATEVMETEVWKSYKQLGDLGDVIYQLKAKDKKETRGEKVELSVKEVYEELVEVAKESGVGSQERKVRRLGKLLRNLDSLGAKYVVRLVVGRLRLGFSDMTVLDALSWMRQGDKRDRSELERAFNVSADLVKIAKVYRQSGKKGLVKIRVTPGVPIRPAKAERLGTMEEIMNKLKMQREKFKVIAQSSELLEKEGRREGDEVFLVAVEPKLDGMRVQVHLYKPKAMTQNSKSESHGSRLKLFGEESGVEVKVFSRGMEDITHQFPEIVAAGIELRQKVGQDLILDGEAIGYDSETGRLLPFQETVKRKRKHAVGKTAKEIPMKVFSFDLLYADEELLSWEYWRRRQKLESVLAEAEQVFELTEMKLVARVKEMQKWFQKWIDQGLEGMMCKRLDGVYQAGARNFNWVKYKRAHEQELADTLDCVVMGYYRGRGKRNKFGLGAFLVGVRRGESYVTIAKIGTGLSDEQWQEMKSRLSQWEVKEKPVEFEVDKNLEPDVWVVPKVVVEIEADEITKSPIHTAGYALRFPRLVRFRDDKEVIQITNLKEVEELRKLES